MSTQRTATAIGCAAILMLIAAGCDPGPAEPTGPQPSLQADPGSPGPSGQAPRAPRAEEAWLHALAERIPGFGGSYVDTEGNLVALVKQRNSARDEAARRLLRPVQEWMNRSGPPGRSGAVRVRDADYTFPELAAYRDELTDSLLGRGLGVRSTDADEAQNRVVVGVAHAGARGAVMQFVARRGLPARAVVIVDEGAIEFEGDGMPIAGISSANGEFYSGLRIMRPKGDGTYSGCTLGFYATLGGTTVGVSNSHCSRDRDSNGGDGTPFYTTGLAYLGSETHDRNHYDWCPTLLGWFRFCRSADAMLFTAAGGGPVPAYRKIARYTVLNAGSSISPAYLTVDVGNPIRVFWRYATVSGEIINKSGATTGWTQGWVTATCKDFEMWVVPLGPVYKCQHEGNYGRADGDSGAPVYAMASGGADLKGIHWGRGMQVTGWKTVFSPLSGIERDFGPLGELPVGGGSVPPAPPGCDPTMAITEC